MKKLLCLAVALAGTLTMQGQGADFGFKAGVNIANFTGDTDTESITSFHAGLLAEFNIMPLLSIQAEALYSAQGAEFETPVGEVIEFNLDYISVPLLAKVYVIPSRVSLLAGPQFSFLINEAEESFNAKSFDMAATGGVEVKVIAGLFAQARYTIGLSDVYDNDDVVNAKNSVVQISVGYFF